MPRDNEHHAFVLPTSAEGESSSPKGFVSNIFKNPFKSESRKGSTSSGGTEEAAAAAAAAGVIGEEAGSDNSATQKAIDSAKNFGSFLSSVANKAGQTVSSTAKQLKHTVESSSLLSDFTKEQQEFLKEHGGSMDAADAPWVGCENEEEVKGEIISLSQDKRNFVRNPPAGVEFDFDLKASLPIALSILKEDPNLSKMRYEIVPKLVNEETFWRNYFYRVSLLKQSTQANLMKKASGGTGCKGWGSTSSSEAEGPDEISPSSENAEFISDTFQGSAGDPLQRSDTIQSTTSGGVRRTDSIRATDGKANAPEKTLQYQWPLGSPPMRRICVYSYKLFLLCNSTVL